MICNMKTQAAASNGRAAVLLGESEFIGLILVRYAPRAIGAWDRRAEYDALCDRAAAKLGYKRDRRCRNGWRKQSGAAQ